MKTNNILSLCIALLVVICLNASGAQNRIMFSPGLSSCEVGDTIEVNIVLDSGVVDLFAYSVHIKYDSTILKIVDANPTSEWLSLSGTDQYFVNADSVEINPESNDSNWYYHVFDVLFTNPKKTISGYAEIATIKLLAKQSGMSNIYYQFYRGSDTLLNNIISYTDDAFVYVCPVAWVPGNIDGEGEVDIGDLVYFVDYSFRSGPEPVPNVLVGDMDCNLEVDIVDLVYMVDYQFRGGPPPCDPCL